MPLTREVKFYFKSCPKCRGDLYTQLVEPDLVECLQCGFSKYIPIANRSGNKKELVAAK